MLFLLENTIGIFVLFMRYNLFLPFHLIEIAEWVVCRHIIKKKNSQIEWVSVNGGFWDINNILCKIIMPMIRIAEIIMSDLPGSRFF